MGMGEGLSVADAMALNGGNNGGGMFGGGGGSEGLLGILFIIALLGGNGGGGLFGGGGNDAVANQVTNDFLFANLNTTMQNGFQNTNAQMREIGNGLCNLGYTNLSNFKDLSTQMASCCCETNRNIDAVRYEAAQNTCAITTAIDKSTDRVIALINSNTMQELRDSLQSANLALNNVAQTQNLVRELKPCPVPAYITCSPYTSPCGSGCGC